MEYDLGEPSIYLGCRCQNPDGRGSIALFPRGNTADGGLPMNSGVVRQTRFLGHPAKIPLTS